MDLHDYLNQRTEWMARGRFGQPTGTLDPIKGMDLVHRKSAAKWMVKNAGTIYLAYKLCELRRSVDRPAYWGRTPDDLGTLLAEISRPDEWITRTPLYQGLTDDMPEVDRQLIRRDALGYARGRVT